MKITLVFLILCTFLGSFGAKFQHNPRDDTAEVISEVTYEFFTRHDIDFDFIMLGRSSRKFEDTFNDVVKIHSTGKKNFHVNNLREWNGKNALVMVEDVKTAQNLYDSSKHLTSNERPKFLFFMPMFEEFDKWAWTTRFFLSFFLFKLKDRFELKTYNLWTEKACNVEQTLTLNFYDRKTQKWQKPLKLEEKFQNFHGCPLKIFSSFYWLPIFDIFQEVGMTYLHPGMQPIIDKRNAKEKEILRVFAEAGNFTAIEARTKYDQDVQIIVQNGGFWYRRYCSMGVFQYTFLFMYSPPDPYTNYEKMLLPFDNYTWMYLILVLWFIFIGIFIMNRMRRARRLMYGNDRSMSYFNVVATLFGIGQTRLPNTIFGRIVLTTFVFFCLTLRAAYQGVFFEMFTSEILRAPPKTFLDLKERNYTIFMTESPHASSEFLGYMIPESDRPKVQIVGQSEVLSIYEKLTNSSLKASIPSTEVDLKVFRAGFTPRKVLEESINFAPSGVCVTHGHFYVHQNQKVSNALISAGIIQYWYSYLLDFEIKPVEEPQKEPKVFAVEDLKFGFIVWLVACAVSAVGFAAEWIFFGGRKFMLEIVPGLTAMLFVVRFLSKKVLL